MSALDRPWLVALAAAVTPVVLVVVGRHVRALREWLVYRYNPVKLTLEYIGQTVHGETAPKKFNLHVEARARRKLVGSFRLSLVPKGSGRPQSCPIPQLVILDRPLDVEIGNLIPISIDRNVSAATLALGAQVEVVLTIGARRYRYITKRLYSGSLYEGMQPIPLRIGKSSGLERLKTFTDKVEG